MTNVDKNDVKSDKKLVKTVKNDVIRDKIHVKSGKKHAKIDKKWPIL